MKRLNDYATIKYNSEGVKEWGARYNSPRNFYDGANAIAVDGSGNVYVTGTSHDSRGSSIYTTIKYSQGTVNIEKDNQFKTYKYHLSQNYPNPFNPETTIEFEITHSADVKLFIFNLNGQLIKKLISEQLTPGKYSKSWNGTNQFGKEVSSGLYIYQFTVDNWALKETKDSSVYIKLCINALK